VTGSAKLDYTGVFRTKYEFLLGIGKSKRIISFHRKRSISLKREIQKSLKYFYSFSFYICL